jgi:septum site-determining protein MinC
MVRPHPARVKRTAASSSPGSGAKMRALWGAMAGDPAKPFVLEGMVSVLNVLRVQYGDLDAIAGALALKVAQSPQLFKGAPVVIDVSALESDPVGTAGAELSIAALSALLKQRGMVPVGVYARSDARLREAASAGLPLIDASRPGKRLSEGSRKPQPFPDQEKPRSASAAPAPAPAPVTEPTTQGALMLTQPLRGGQIVHAAQRDAICLAAVNAGAELIADGNIHVYSTLRGRALAGAHGDENARIFCQRLEADLISIAGVYLSADEIPTAMVGKAVQVALRNGELVLTELVPR